MLHRLEPADAVAAVVRHIENSIEGGLCAKCALILASKDLDVPYERVERVWIDTHVLPQ